MRLASAEAMDHRPSGPVVRFFGKGRCLADRFGLAIILTMLAAGAAFAGDGSGSTSAVKSAQQKRGARAVMPDNVKLNLLIRTSIIALNHANQTGNYTVLQNLGAPGFRAANDSARLARVFAALRKRHLDLSPILYFTPKLFRPPIIGPDGLLRMAGFFPTSPERVNFELVFQRVGGRWRIFGIGVTTSSPDATAALPSTSQSTEPPQRPPQSKVQRVPPPVRRPPLRRKTSGVRDVPTPGGASRHNSVRIDFAAPRTSPGGSEAWGAAALKADGD